MQTLLAGGREFSIDRARVDDVPEIVALLGDDTLGTHREADDLEPYLRAFAVVDADPAQYLAVVRPGEAASVDALGARSALCGTMQLTLIPGLSRSGATRLQLEAVRVGPDARGAGLGTAMLTWAHDYGREHGATLCQLTTDQRRSDAQRFYARLGYRPSHVGMKLVL